MKSKSNRKHRRYTPVRFRTLAGRLRHRTVLRAVARERKRIVAKWSDGATLAFACISCGGRYPEHVHTCELVKYLCFKLSAGNPCVEPKGHRGAHVTGTPHLVHVRTAKRKLAK